MRTRRGFTLGELLVVIAIIAMLGALLMSTMGKSWQIARTILCANNLKRISESVQTWATETESWQLGPLASGGWPGVVTKYASRDCLLCPEEDMELKEGVPVEAQVQILASSSTGIPLVPLNEGGSYKVLKLSDTQWRAAIAECARFEPVPYVPDENPNVYWWGYDDGAIGQGDYDFQDVAIKVTKHGDGTATLWIQACTAGKPQVGDMDFNVIARHEEINSYYFGSGISKTLNVTVGGGSHYGMNCAHMDVRTPGKILALDYLAAIAFSTDQWDQPDWDEDEDGRPDFVRHGQRLNVLFMDGTVRTMWPEQVDPIDVHVERKYWQRR